MVVGHPPEVRLQPAGTRKTGGVRASASREGRSVDVLVALGVVVEALVTEAV